MATRRTELQYLENYRQVFSNFSEVPDLKTEMAEFGYDDAKMQEGKALYDEVLALYNQNKQETAEEKEAYNKFSQAYDALNAAYAKHRKIAKVALMNRPDLWKSLAIAGATSKAYLQWAQDAATLYTQAKTHAEAQPLLEKFKLTPAVADEQLAKLEELRTLRDAYNKEKGESQDATKAKDAAFAKIADWMREFYAVAKIALDDRPQLLESIGKWMRS